jgi:hypothetical protein
MHEHNALIAAAAVDEVGAAAVSVEAGVVVGVKENLDTPLGVVSTF